MLKVTTCRTSTSVLRLRTYSVVSDYRRPIMTAPLHALCFVLLAASVKGYTVDDLRGRLVGHLTKAFYEVRHPIASPEGLQKARDYVYDFWDSLHRDTASSLFERQTFESHKYKDDKWLYSYNDTNMIYILPSARWGTSEDRLLIVMSDYSTAKKSPGVDNSGSGMAANLEMSRLLSLHRNSSCALDISVIFVAVGMTALGIQPSGSGFFLKHYLVPKLTREKLDKASFVGVLMLKGLLNFDALAKSQNFPFGVSVFMSEEWKRIDANDHRGDFMAMLSLTSNDALVDVIVAEWAKRDESMRRFRVEKMTLNVNEQMIAFLKSSQIPMDVFAYVGKDEDALLKYDLKPVLVTDTREMRGYMAKCTYKPCDNLDYALTDDNELFFTLAVDTLVHAIARIGTCPLKPMGHASAVLATYAIQPAVLVDTKRGPKPLVTTLSVSERTTVVSNGRSLRSSAMFLVLVAFWTTIVTNSPAGCSLLGRARWQTSSANQWNV